MLALGLYQMLALRGQADQGYPNHKYIFMNSLVLWSQSH